MVKTDRPGRPSSAQSAPPRPSSMPKCRLRWLASDVVTALSRIASTKPRRFAGSNFMRMPPPMSSASGASSNSAETVKSRLPKSSAGEAGTSIREFRPSNSAPLALKRTPRAIPCR